jgi:hypothetical protein
LAAGKYRGVVVVNAYGYHSLSGVSFKHHRLYRRSKDQFLADYLADRRAAELACLAEVGPGIRACPKKLWVVSAVAKQDLWRPEEGEADRWYRTGEYGREIAGIIPPRASATVRHELASLSLVISNFVTDRGEVLRRNAEGYDHRAQVESVRRLIELLDGLRAWEAAR